jgi:hypothetical protein
MEQLVPTGRELPQVVVSAKSVGFSPPITMLVIVSGPVPVLLKVMVCGELELPTKVLAKVRLDGFTPAVGTPMPDPVSAAVCVEPFTFPALSVTISTPLRLPGAPGVKVTEMRQFDPAATEPAQLFEAAKSDAFAPPMAMLAMVNAAVPELLRVMVCAPLAVATFWLGKTTVLGATAAAGTPAPVPVKFTVCVVPDTLLALSVIVIIAVRVPVAAGVKVTEMAQLEPAAKLSPQLFVWA